MIHACFLLAVNLNKLNLKEVKGCKMEKDTYNQAIEIVSKRIISDKKIDGSNELLLDFIMIHLGGPIYLIHEKIRQWVIHYNQNLFSMNISDKEIDKLAATLVYITERDLYKAVPDKVNPYVDFKIDHFKKKFDLIKELITYAYDDSIEKKHKYAKPKQILIDEIKLRKKGIFTNVKITTNEHNVSIDSYRCLRCNKSVLISKCNQMHCCDNASSHCLNNKLCYLCWNHSAILASIYDDRLRNILTSKNIEFHREFDKVYLKYMKPSLLELICIHLM